MDSTDRLARLHSVNDPNQAEFIKNLLQEHDIECCIDGEQQGGLPGISRVNVIVWERDYDRAKDVLDRHQMK